MRKTRTAFDRPLRTIRFDRPGAGLDAAAWVAVRSEVCRWTVAGCAAVRGRAGDFLDVVTLHQARPEDLAGGELVVFHKHLAERFPDDAKLLWQPE